MTRVIYIKHIFFILAGTFVFLLLVQSPLCSAHAQEKPTSTAKEIMENAYDIAKVEGIEMVSTLTLINKKGKRRVRKMAIISKLTDQGETEKSLIRFISPADVKGTGLLTYDYENKDDDLWFFLPALRKTRRIVASEKAKSFMGSEFSYADITPPTVDNFRHTIQKEEIVDQTQCWVIDSVPKDHEIAEENGFYRKTSYIGKKDFVVRKAIYYDLDNELEKELTVLEIKEIDTEKHKFRPTRLFMNNIQNGNKSELLVEELQLRKDIPDDYFTIRYLERQ